MVSLSSWQWRQCSSYIKTKGSPFSLPFTSYDIVPLDPLGLLLDFWRDNKNGGSKTVSVINYLCWCRLTGRTLSIILDSKEQTVRNRIVSRFAYLLTSWIHSVSLYSPLIILQGMPLSVNIISTMAWLFLFFVFSCSRQLPRNNRH